MRRMTTRGVTRYGLLAVMAILASTAVAWSCALWAPMTTSRPLSEAEAAEIMARRLDARQFIPTPDGTENSGLGWKFVFVVDAAIVEPPRRARPRSTTPATGGPNAGRHALTSGSGNATDTYVQIVLAGWPATCYQGTTEMFDQSLTHHGLFTPPELASNLGVKPRRLVPLYPRWTGLAVNSVFYGAIFWLAIPAPKLLRRALRRRRGQCADCGYDLAHHEHDTCPECGTG